MAGDVAGIRILEIIRECAEEGKHEWGHRFLGGSVPAGLVEGEGGEPSLPELPVKEAINANGRSSLVCFQRCG